MGLSRRSVLSLQLGGLALLLIAIAGAQAAAAQEIPITTKSQEALKLFLEGRAKDENYHVEEANRLFAQAAAVDPGFALAHLSTAFTAADPKVTDEELRKAVALIENVSKGEQLMIAARQAAWIENDPVRENALLKQLADLFPNDKRAHLYLASSYAGREETDQAIAEFEKAIALDKDFARAHYQLGYVYFPKGEFEKAEEHFQAYLKLAPSEPNPHDCLADLYMKMGRFEEAIRHYEKAVELDPHFSASQLKIGSCCVLLGRYEEGRRAMEKAKGMETEPANKIGDEEAIALSYIYAGEYPKALDRLDSAIRMAGEMGLPLSAANGHQIKSMIFIETDDPAGAAKSLEAFKACLDDPKVAASDKAAMAPNLPLFEALIAVRKGDIPGAKPKLEEFRAASAKINDPLLAKYGEWTEGHIALAQGDAAGADARFTKAAIDDPYFIYYGAVAKEKAGDAAGAKKLYAKVADWNQYTINHALVRSKAKAKI